MLANTPSGDLHRRHDDVRLAETLFPANLQFALTEAIDAADLASLDELTEAQHREAAQKAARRSLVAAAVFRVAAEAYVEAPGYRASAG